MTLSAFDVVRLNRDRPQYGLQTGEIGTVIEAFADGDVEVEFVDDEGRVYASPVLRPDQLALAETYPPSRAKASTSAD